MDRVLPSSTPTVIATPTFIPIWDREDLTEKESYSSRSTYPSLAVTILSLIGVCVLAYFVLHFLYTPARRYLRFGSKNIEIWDRVNLIPQKALFLSLVKVGKRLFLLGISEQRVNLLYEFSEKEIEEMSKVMHPAVGGGYVPGKGFKEIIGKIFPIKEKGGE